MLTPVQLEDLLTEYKQGLLSLYGDRLAGVRLFGSYARLEAQPESDVDILIVLRSMTSYAGEIRRTSRLNASLSLKYGVSVSRVFITDEAWRAGHGGFVGAVRTEAVAV